MSVLEKIRPAHAEQERNKPDPLSGVWFRNPGIPRKTRLKYSPTASVDYIGSINGQPEQVLFYSGLHVATVMGWNLDTIAEGLGDERLEKIEVTDINKPRNPDTPYIMDMQIHHFP